MSKGKTICTVCNYIYDEVLGEPRQEILPAKSFSDLAEDWVCPECGSGKEMFQPCSCVSLPIYEKTCVIHSEAEWKSAPNDINAISRDISVGELVTRYPASACVLEENAIDYCCGGKVSLEDACLKKGLNVESILEKLASAVEQKKQSSELDCLTINLKFLINHIIETYHDPLRLELSRILPLAEKVARVHGKKHPEMVTVLETFARFKEELEVHMQKEELILFPSIAAAEIRKGIQKFACGGIEGPIQVMMEEHESAGEMLCTLRSLTNSYTPPEDACTSFKLLLASLAQLESEMHQHVHKENNILFPKAAELFTTGAGVVQKLQMPANSR